MATSCLTGVLSRDTDVGVSVIKQSPADIIDISNLMIATTETNSAFDPGAPVKYYSSLTEGQVDWASTTEPYRAMNIFFQQSPRPAHVAVGIVYKTAFAGFVEGRPITAVIADFNAVTDGEFTVTINGDTQNILALDFSLDADLDDVASRIETAIQAIGTGGYTAATFVYNSTAGRFELTSGTTGDGSTVTGLSPVPSGTGTDISGDSYLDMYDDPGTDADNLRIVDGRTPTGIADELAILSNYAAGCLDKPWIAFALTRELRDDEGDTDFKALDAATWAAGASKICGIDSEDPNVKDASITTDIASVLETAGNRWATVCYHDDPAQYQSVSANARLLGTDLFATNSTITLKFKDLPGVNVLRVSSTELAAITGKKANFLSIVAQDERIFREGTTSNDDWFWDQTYYLEMMRLDAQTEVYSVLKIQNAVRYNAVGQGQLYNALDIVGRKYVNNGFLAEREDTTTGETLPAYTINVPIPNATVRSGRDWPGITMDVNLAGATHTVNITITAFD